jgi:ubiquinone/menaquinone biosynthesis C-methylase UbiE
MLQAAGGRRAIAYYWVPVGAEESVAASGGIDADAFNRYERQAWETVAGAYIDGFEMLTRQSIDPLLDAIAAKGGTRVLDIACGPGWVAGAAGSRGARVVGIDASAAMLDEARRAYPDLAFCRASAEALPFGDGQFDAVCCNFGLLHLGRPDDALGEAARVLRPGGRVGFTVWAAPDETAAFGIVLGAIQAHGKADIGLPAGPPFFRFSDPKESMRALRAAGFAEPTVRLVPQRWRLSSAERLFDVMCEATARTRGLILGQSAEAREAIRHAVVAAAKKYRQAEGIDLPMPSVLATALKPV